MPDYSQIRSLFLRYMEGAITAEERMQLSEAAETYSLHEWEEILEPLAQTTNPNQDFNIADWEKEIQFILSQKPVPVVKKAGVVPMYGRRVFRWIAAACIIGVMGYALWVMSGKKSRGRSQKSEIAVHDVPAPKETRAVITLADGSKVYLDSAGNGVLARQNNVNVVKNDNGQIAYQAVTQSGAEATVTYNTLTNPRGSKVIDLALSDGSHVWLNAGSSITFPVAFTGKERRVEMTGEAYFEIAKAYVGTSQRDVRGTQRGAHGERQTFVVAKGDMEVTVLGTHFNVNAYDDEADIKVTLLEGSVRVNNRAGNVTIKPGEQAIVTNKQQPKTTSNIDLDNVIAWQHGLFEFNNADLNTILRQVSRWYDVDVIYEGKPSTSKMGGGISRNLPLSKVLKLLESNGAKFRLEGRKLFVQ